MNFVHFNTSTIFDATRSCHGTRSRWLIAVTATRFWMCEGKVIGATRSCLGYIPTGRGQWWEPCQGCHRRVSSEPGERCRLLRLTRSLWPLAAAVSLWMHPAAVLTKFLMGDEKKKRARNTTTCTDTYIYITTTTHNTIPTQHNITHNTTRRQRQRRKTKRRSPPQACFTILRVLTCVSTFIPSIHSCIHTYIYIYILRTWIHIYTHLHVHVQIYIYIYICYHESSRTQQHSKWNCVRANRPQRRHMYSHITCD